MVEHTSRTVEYTYDDTYKLLEEKITNPDSSTSVISYTYDTVGNRKTKTENGFTTTYTYNENNQLVREDDISYRSYRYDDNGNLNAKNSAEEQIEYFYDAENHLTRVETTRFGVTIVVEYEYDAEGNRVRKVLDGTVVTNYLVDSNRDYAQVLEERDGSGNLLVRYVYGHDLISQTRDGAINYYHYDGLGSVRALTTSSGAVTDTYTYDAFGNLTDRTGSTTNDYLFTGEQFDANLGFYYLRARYMNPEIGRFVTMDTFAGGIRDPYSLHKYLYAHANPVNHIDPSGYETKEVQEVKGLIINIFARIQNPLTKRIIGVLVRLRTFSSIQRTIYISFKVNPLRVLLRYLAWRLLTHYANELTKPTLDEGDDEQKTLRARHHTSHKGLDGIKRDGVIKTSRPAQGLPIGVDVELEPFGPARTASKELDAYGKGAYVEFDVRVSEVTLTPHLTHADRNAGRIITEVPLILQGRNPKFKKLFWWED